MSEFIPADQRARELILTDLDRTFLVEAGAGSGKTTSLVGRMLALVEAGKCSVLEIAAVTFTRKAAAELRERFQLKLEQRCREETDVQKRHRLECALDNLHQAFIGTIHSFCGLLLRERPIEAGLSPEFVEMDDWEAAMRAEQAWGDYVHQISQSDPQQLAALLELNVSLADLKALYLKLIMYSDVEFVAAQVSLPDLSRVINEMDKFVEEALPFLPTECPDKGWDSLQSIVRRYQRARHAMGLKEKDDPRYFTILERSLSEPKVVQKRWLDKKAAKTLSDRFKELQVQQISPVVTQWREHRYKPILDFLLPVVRYYDEIRKQKNRLTFQDLLSQTRDLLRDNSEVRRYFQIRFSHLLVDEFQDTDPIQAEIMLYLTGADCEEPDYSRLLIKPGRLFVVGDPKQSIYRFRRADIDVYNRVKDQIEGSGGEVLSLCANFRSHSSIVNWVNNSFQSLFGENQAPYQATYTPMQPARVKLEQSAGVYRLDLPPGLKVTEITETDARTLAEWIAWATTGGIELPRSQEELEEGIEHRARPEDIMILLHYKKELPLYAAALEAQRIPYNLSGGGRLADCRGYISFLRLLQAVADPLNQVALVAALRDVCYGMSDFDLDIYKRAGGAFYFLEDLPKLPPDQVDRFHDAWLSLRQFHAWSQELPPRKAAEKILDASGLVPFISQSMSSGQAGQVLKAIELLQGLDESHLASFRDVVEYLSELAERELDDELDLAGGRAHGVRIMNLHKAKGLEAPIVILANPGRKVTIEPDIHVGRKFGKPTGYLCFTRQRGHSKEVIAHPGSWERYRDEEGSYLGSEAVRLLYVAATRAKSLLLITTCPDRLERSPWQAIQPFMVDARTLNHTQNIDTVESGGDCEDLVTLWRKAQAQADHTRRTLLRSTYQKESVTSLVKDSFARPNWSASGKGMVWGSYVHKAVELLAKIDPPYNLASVASSAVEAVNSEPGADLAELVDHLQQIVGSEFWARLLSAKRCLVEVPFGLFENERYLSGVIDLVLDEEGGVVLADYKSDQIESEEQLRQLVAYYTPQVLLYRQCWEKITRKPVKEAGIFFTSLLRFVAVH